MITQRATASGLRYANFAMVGIAIVAYLVAFGRDRVAGVITFFPFTMIPFLVSAYFVARWQNFWSQSVLLLTIAGYSAWFAYVYYYATVIHHLSSTSPIAFLFVTAYA